MPNSYSFYKSEIKEYFEHHVPKHKKILDVGPGQGTYAKLLADIGYNIDAVEVWTPYINEFKLHEWYRVIHNADIREFDWSEYDYIILGDILEHLTAEEGQKLITDITDAGKECLVAIPYRMAQDGEEYGNSYETHLQEDLTYDVMKTRYPQLVELYSNHLYGYYTNKRIKVEKAYVLYANASYVPTVKACVASIKAVSDLPIYVYLLDVDVDIPGAITVRWVCDLPSITINKYINRNDKNVYRLLIERSMVIKNALLNYAHTVAYVDSDSVATKYIDRIFSMYNPKLNYPYFVEGIYDYLHINGRGGADSREDMSTTLEAPACELFNVNQYVRQRYRQTGYFVASHYCFDFLDEWYWMCIHPKVMANHELYAPYHEETLANVLLWKWNKLDGLPYIYTNASLDKIDSIYNKLEWGKHHSSWFRLPDNKSDLLFLHGEKSPEIMYDMIEELSVVEDKLNILFIAPHLSTGGMPAFLQKTIDALQNLVRISVIEYQCQSLDYVVQRNAIKKLVDVYTLYENKMDLFDIINKIKPDIIHIQEPSERLDREMIKKLYDSNRTYKIVETCHDISFNPDNEKVFHPDAYAFCTPYHLKTFNKLPSYKEVIEFPIESKFIDCEAKTKLGFNLNRINVINVGLWTSGKNQGEGLDIARKYPDIDFHFIGNQAGNFKDYWEPLMKDVPSNVKIWGERADIDVFMQAADVFMFNSTWECNPLVLREAISYGLPIIARNLPQYENMFTDYIQPIDTDLYNIKATYAIPDQLNDYTNTYHSFYKTVMHVPFQEQKVNIIQYFINNPFLEIKGVSDSNFKVCFYEENGILNTEFNIKTNHWVKLNRQYYTKWTTKIWQDDKLIYNYTLDYTGKTVFINIDSKSLGDTIAWIPYCLEFQKKHNCKVIVSSFWNKILDYPELEFVEPGTSVNTYAQYTLGWHYDSNKEPVLPNTIPLQQAATNILGLDFEEIKPNVKFSYSDSKYGRYVTIATNSTAGCKFWTREGWQEVINHLHDKGYKIVNVSKEDNPFENCVKIDDVSIENTMSVIHHSEFFIGLSSGLSWLAWAVGAQVVMISNFTNKDHEFQSNCIRITDESLCHGCWNNSNFKFDKGDWDWCPINKNTLKHFECHKGISANVVIEKIKGIV